ncbi:MAG TPA: ABC transporter permease [Chthoniobacterales bacterium]|nr:ABC transporter permease [Chthoniobacterales bacterium]
MIPFLALIRKDLKLFLRDRRAVVVGLLVPIVCGSFFGYLFGGHKGIVETSKVPVLVMDQDESEISRALVSELAAEKNLAVQQSTLEAARDAVRKGKATAAIIIPKGFGAEAGRALFRRTTKPEIGLLYDPSHNVEFSMVKGILTGAVMQSVSREMFRGRSGLEMVNQSLVQLENADLPPDDKTALLHLLTGVKEWNERQGNSTTLGGGLSTPYETRDEAITSGKNVEYNGYAHSFAGMGVQFILFMGLDVGITLLMLRQSGLWQRLRAAPLSRATLLGSRAISAALIAGFILFVLFAFARLVFGVHIQGSFAGFLGICAAFCLMTAAFGLMVAALGETVEATRGYSILATLVMVMLGGAWVPTFVFPEWLQKLTVIIPTRWAIDGFDGMTWRGLGFSSALAPIAVLLLFTLLFGTLAVMRFRWRTDE